MEVLWLILIFIAISFVYSSVGFGGGSSYLAFMAIFAIAPENMKPIALICNIIVVSGGSYLYYKKGLLNLREIIPLVILSIPMAFVGAYLQISNKIFFIILGSTLIISSLFMFFDYLKKQANNKNHQTLQKKKIFGNVATGGLVGFIAGMVGIGGGIFLTSFLHLTRWSKAKKIAAACSFFILVNSIAGLTGQLIKYKFNIDYKLLIPLALAVFIGGQIGSRLSIGVFNPSLIKILTTLLIFYVGLRILVLQFFGIKI